MIKLRESVESDKTHLQRLNAISKLVSDRYQLRQSALESGNLVVRLKQKPNLPLFNIAEYLRARLGVVIENHYLIGFNALENVVVSRRDIIRANSYLNIRYSESFKRDLIDVYIDLTYDKVSCERSEVFPLNDEKVQAYLKRAN